MNYPCTQCGLCCRHVDRVPELAAMDRGDGACIHLNEEQRNCNIYASRPRLCRVDELYPHFAAAMTPHAFHQANADVCNALQEEHVFPVTFRVRIPAVAA